MKRFVFPRVAHHSEGCCARCRAEWYRVRKKWLGHTVLVILRGTRPAEERVIGEKKGDGMPRVDVEGVGAVDVPEGKRLVLAIEEDAGVDILHCCGGYARCTTCRIEYLEGEPEKMTKAELEVLERKNLLGQARLSCQAVADHDVKVRPLATVSSTGAEGPGRKPEPEITPEPEWVEKPI